MANEHDWPEYFSRVTYYTRQLSTVETARYRDDDGNQLVIESRHTPFTVVGRAGGSDDYDIQRVDDQGREGYLLKVRRARGLVPTGGTYGVPRVERYAPADEASVPSLYLYPTLADAEIAAGIPRAVTAEAERERAMRDRARAAAEQVDGEGATDWSRAAYEAACAAAGLPPAPDDKITTLNRGVYVVPDYHADHCVWRSLIARRHWGMVAETEQAEKTAVARAGEVAGTGPYSRDQYEAACAAAGVPALPDHAARSIAETYLLGKRMPVRNVLGEMHAERALGTTPQAAATLASRRVTGIDAERVKRRRAKREELAAQGHQFATPGQVDEIMDLLVEQVEPGFFAGPTDREGVENLSQQDASTYITSLRGEY